MINGELIFVFDRTDEVAGILANVKIVIELELHVCDRQAPSQNFDGQERRGRGRLRLVWKNSTGLYFLKISTGRISKR